MPSPGDNKKLDSGGTGGLRCSHQQLVPLLAVKKVETDQLHARGTGTTADPRVDGNALHRSHGQTF